MRYSFVFSLLAIGAFTAPLPTEQARDGAISERYSRTFGEGLILSSRGGEGRLNGLADKISNVYKVGGKSRPNKAREAEAAPANYRPYGKREAEADPTNYRPYGKREAEADPTNYRPYGKREAEADPTNYRPYGKREAEAVLIHPIKSRDLQARGIKRPYKTREPVMREYKAREEDVQEQEVEAEVDVDTRSLYDEEDTAKLDFIE